jgi:hypothetical protein
MASSDETLAEFDGSFPEIGVIEVDPHPHPREAALRAIKFAPHSRQAQALLGQLEGWVTGLIEEFEYEQRNPDH